jgi:hypothetical protein
MVWSNAQTGSAIGVAKSSIVSSLAPFTPYLVKGAEEAAKAAGKN